MRLHYWHREQYTNFGDMLNPWLWPSVFPDLFDDDSESLFLGIGTVLNHGVPKAKRTYVLGSGLGYGDPPAIDDSWTFYAVRGPLTRDALCLPSGVPLGDPAILAPDFLTDELPLPKDDTSGPVFVPHWKTTQAEWAGVCGRAGLSLIDPLAPVAEVLHRIKQSTLVVAEAMHGAIVADAFRVPWIAVHSDFPDYLPFKWQDWCGSLGLEYRSQPIVRPWSAPDWRVRPGRSAVKACLAPARRRLVARRLRQILDATPPMLSSDAAHERSKEGLYRAIERMKGDLGNSGVVGSDN